jgi:hypothetical protein
MLSLMLDSTFKNLCLMLPFIGLVQGRVIVEKHDRQNLVSHVVKMLSSFAHFV